MQQNLRVSVWSLACISSLAVFSANAYNIAWVSFSSGDNTPSSNAAGAGFTQAPDIGYTDLLNGNGHTVTRFQTADNFNVSQLVGYDLVIIGRGVNSGHYESATETAAWNGFGGKLMDMSGYTLRNSRLGFTTGGTMPDTAGTVALKPTSYHPIFSGIPIDGASGNMFNPFASIVTYIAFGTNNVTTRGISVNTDALEGGGTVLATIGTQGDPAFGGMVIGLWDKGAVINGGTDVLGGWRMVFLSGSREANGVSSETAGIYDLSADGAKLFLNSVDYFVSVVPEPSTAALFAIGGLALLLRRKKA